MKFRVLTSIWEHGSTSQKTLNFKIFLDYLWLHKPLWLQEVRIMSQWMCPSSRFSCVKTALLVADSMGLMDLTFTGSIQLNKMVSLQTRRTLCCCWRYANKLNLWHQNPQAYHHIHKCLPLVPILSQLDPLYAPTANLPKIHSDPILSPMPWSSKWSLSFWLCCQNLVHFLLPCVSRVPPTSFYLGSTNYESSQSVLLTAVRPAVRPILDCYPRDRISGTWNWLPTTI
jgi:hypothetical protein